MSRSAEEVLFDDAISQQMEVFAARVHASDVLPEQRVIAEYSERDLVYGGVRVYRFTATGHFGHMLKPAGTYSFIGAARVRKTDWAVEENWAQHLMPEDIAAMPDRTAEQRAYLEEFGEFSLLTNWLYKVSKPDTNLFRTSLSIARGRVLGTNDWREVPLLVNVDRDTLADSQDSRRANRSMSRLLVSDRESLREYDLEIAAAHIASILEKLSKNEHARFEQKISS